MTTTKSTSFAYRGYLVTRCGDAYTVSKGGFHICWAKSEQAAREAIDGLVD